METEIKRIYWDNGKLYSEQPYVDGKPHGIIKWWWQDGGIDEFCLYNQGEQVAVFYPKDKTKRWKLK
jgi:antitoxin component YwqK of YwqJK toxin-antitoxin module